MYHQALYKWHILNIRDIPEPKRNPYLSEEIFSEILKIKDGGLLNLAKMSSGEWYRAMLEINVTMDSDTEQIYKPCRTEIRNPHIEWESVWALSNLNGLCSSDKTFLWRMLHNILPTQERLHRLGMRNAPSPICTHCNTNIVDSLSHSLISCSQNRQVADWFLHLLRPHVLHAEPAELVLLNFGHLPDEMQLPVVWTTAQVLGNIWSCRKEKKRPQLFQTRATLEAGVEILRKTRYKEACNKIESMILAADNSL